MALRLLFLLILISVIKGGIQTAVKVGLEGLPPMGFIGWRNLLAIGFMAAGALAVRRFRKREAWWPAFGVGPLLITGVMLGGTMLLYVHGMVHTTASRATVISSAQPLFVLALARVFLPGERITLAKGAGLVLGFVGINLLFFGGGFGGRGESSILGDGLVLGGAFLWAVQSIYEKKIIPNYRPFTLVFWQIAFTMVLMLGLSAVLEQDRPLVFNTRTTTAFLYMVFPVTLFVYPTYMYVLQYVEVSRISYFNFVMTVSGVLLGVLLLGDPVTLALVVSLVLVSAGVILVMRPRQ